MYYQKRYHESPSRDDRKVPSRSYFRLSLKRFRQEATALRAWEEQRGTANMPDTTRMSETDKAWFGLNL